MRIFGLLTGLSLLGLISSVWPALGKRPDGDYRKRFRSSPNYNTQQRVFENRIPDLIEKMNKRVYKWKVMREWFRAGVDREPGGKLPEIKPDLAKFLEPSADIKVIWFGHSSFLLNLEGSIVLVDPVFSESASPVRVAVKRFQPPVLKLSELPKVDYVLISHDHYDHLDMNSIKFFADKKSQFITPLGVGSHLKSWGIAASRIIEKDWWESKQFKSIKFIATPAQHFSGRNGVKPNETLWASWVIQTDRHNIYFSGDSGYDIHFKEIGDKYGPFDVAFIESGQYNENWPEVHMLPAEAATAFRDLKAKKYFPIHWGMFVLSLHTWYDPVEKLEKLSREKNFDLLTPRLGEIVNVNSFQLANSWWRQVMKTASIESEPVLEPSAAVEIDMIEL